MSTAMINMIIKAIGIDENALDELLVLAKKFLTEHQELLESVRQIRMAQCRDDTIFSTEFSKHLAEKVIERFGDVDMPDKEVLSAFFYCQNLSLPSLLTDQIE